MSGSGPGDWLLAALLLAAGCGATGHGLGRLSVRVPAAVPLGPFPRLRATDLLAAMLLLLLLPVSLARLWPGDLMAMPVGLQLLFNLAVMLPVLLFLRWRAGPGGPWLRSLASLRWAAAAYLWSLPALIGVLHLNALLFSSLTGAAPAQEVARDISAAGPRAWWVVLPMAVLLQPACEELLFRGYLQRFLTARPGAKPLPALLLSAGVFALFHDASAVLPVFAIGLLLGFVYLRTCSLPAAMGTHALHNGLVTLLLLSSPIGP